MRAVHVFLTMALAITTLGGAYAADAPKGPEDRPARFPRMERWEMLRGMDLSDEQKTKVEAIKQEYAPKFKEAADKLDGIFTEEQKKARDEAVAAARAAGRRGPEVWKEAQQAVKLTAEQEAQLAEARKAFAAVRQEAHDKVIAVLTPEQQEQLKSRRPNAGNGPRADRPPRGERGPQAAAGHRGMHGPQRPGFGGGPLQGLTLTEEQKAQLKAIRTEYAPKLREARSQIDTIRKDMHEKVLAMLTPEQKQQMEQCPMMKGPTKAD